MNIRISRNSCGAVCFLMLLAIAISSNVLTEQVASSDTSPLNGYTVTPFAIPAKVQTVHLIDLNADARQDFNFPKSFVSCTKIQMDLTCRSINPFPSQRDSPFGT